MGSSERLFDGRRTLHEIFGGGIVADVILWRQGNVTMGILFSTLAAWVVFERSGYTPLSLASSVLLLLLTIFFLWAKSAAVLNRPAPPLPDLYLSEQTMNEAAAFIRTHVNGLLSISKDIALGKDSRLFLRVAACLCLLSCIGGLTDFPTLLYSCILIALTLPALYVRCENFIDRCIISAYRKLQVSYERFDVKCIGHMSGWSLEKNKLA